MVIAIKNKNFYDRQVKGKGGFLWFYWGPAGISLRGSLEKAAAGAQLGTKQRWGRRHSMKQPSPPAQKSRARQTIRMLRQMSEERVFHREKDYTVPRGNGVIEFVQESS